MANTETHTHTTRCLGPKCGRTLRAKVSTDRGYGPTCYARIIKAAKAAALAKYADKPHLVAKAEELIEAGGITLLRGKTCRTVGNEGALYLTHPKACNCKAGLRARHLCHHRIAADAYTATLAPTRRAA